MPIRFWDNVKCQANTHYPISKFLKSSNAMNLLDVLIYSIFCMNERKMIMLSIDGKRKQKAEKKKKIESITGQIFYVIWQIQEVKFRIDALEKQTTSSYDKAENLG